MYEFTNIREFESNKEVDKELVLEVFKFAYGMSFGNEGHHRKNRSGGKNKRKNGEIFADTFQGKLAEFAFWKELNENSIILSKPDINRTPLGTWDTVDFEYNGYKIAVKSTKSYGHLLLLETADWDNEGLYIPNENSGNGEYDFFILIRINPFTQQLLKTKKLLFSNDVIKEDLEKINFK